MTRSEPAHPAGSRRAYRGPILLKQGFRPFFLAAGGWALAAMLLWLALLHGVALPSAFDPVTWHAHEMLFGFAAAAVAGFLLTAIPNWTGRLPVRGASLGILAAIWLAGRLAVASSALIGALPAALIDLAFLVTFAGVLAREILAGGNWRNLPVVAVVGLLAVGNLLFHLEALDLAATAALGQRLTVAVIVLLISLIGGRIIPSFTRNWLAKRGAGPMPQPFGGVDRLALAATALAGLAWAALPEEAPVGWLALIAALANAIRLSRWCGWRTLSEPLVWILHLGFGWLPIGLALLGLSLLSPTIPQSTAIHALTAGAMGTMILAVMTRATLGHTGQALTAGPGTAAVYLFVTLAAALRILAPIAPSGIETVLALAALCWIGAFGLFLVLYAPKLLSR